MSVLLLCKMNENLGERKLNFLNYLNREHKEKQRSWWGSINPEYQKTRNAAAGSKVPDSNPPEIIVKNSLRNAIITIAFFVFIAVFGLMIKHEEEMDLLSIPFIFIFLAVFLFHAFDRRAKIIIDKHGIWTNSFQAHILWEDISETYIYHDNSGEGTTHYLLIYYYDEELDEFRQTQQSLSLLELGYKKISFWVEKFKSQSGSH
jgi:hypothetical protein